MYWLQQRKFFIILVSPAIIYLIITAFYPLVDSLRLSFFREGEFLGLQNYIDAVTREYFLPNLVRSFFWSISIVLGQNIIGMTFAVLLNSQIKYKNLWRGLQYLPWLLAPTVVAVLWISFCLPVRGLINTTLRNLDLLSLMRDWLGDPQTALPAIIIADIWHWYAFFTIMYLAGMQNVPESLNDAARVDGANEWDIFRHITFPSLKPIILTASIIQFLWVFRFFDLIWIMTKGGPIKSSEILATQIYKTALFRYDFNEAAALGIIMSFIMLIFVLLYLYYYRRGEA